MCAIFPRVRRIFRTFFARISTPYLMSRPWRSCPPAARWTWGASSPASWRGACARLQQRNRGTSYKLAGSFLKRGERSLRIRLVLHRFRPSGAKLRIKIKSERKLDENERICTNCRCAVCSRSVKCVKNDHVRGILRTVSRHAFHNAKANPRHSLTEPRNENRHHGLDPQRSS